jgi:MFS family permease
MDSGYILVSSVHLTSTSPLTMLFRMIFATTLLFAGRLADLYPPHKLYVYPTIYRVPPITDSTQSIGFVGIAVSYLGISFMNNQYAFFVLRAISALLAVLTIPSSVNMISEPLPQCTVHQPTLGRSPDVP